MDLRAVGGSLTKLAWIGLRSFLATFGTLLLAGSFLAAASCYFLWDTHRLVALIAAGIALLESITTGIVFGAKRGIVMAVAHGLGSLRLGRSLVRLLFDRIGRGEEGEEAQPGGRVVRTLERLPLAQAEGLLGDAVRGLTGEAETGGWMRRTIRTRLLGSVAKYTLARFREEGEFSGGIDVTKVRDSLEETIDQRLVEKVRGGLALTTWLVILGLPLTVAAQTFITLAILTRGKV